MYGVVPTGYLLAVSLAVGVAVMAVAFYMGRRENRLDIVDSFWGMNIAMIVAVHALLQPLAWWRVVVLAAVAAWGIRLSFHIARRFAASAHEDPRYTELRKNWSPEHPFRDAFWRVYMVQALLGAMVSLAAVAVIHAPSVRIQWFWLGLGIWLAGYVIEVVADRQLQQFLAGGPAPGAIMQSGLWSVSRHPNYFGEITQWWGIAIASLGTPLWWMGVVGAGTITVLIVAVSGLPPAERRMAGRPGWDEYRRRVSPLVPWFNRGKK